MSKGQRRTRRHERQLPPQPGVARAKVRPAADSAADAAAAAGAHSCRRLVACGALPRACQLCGRHAALAAVWIGRQVWISGHVWISGQVWAGRGESLIEFEQVWAAWQELATQCYHIQAGTRTAGNERSRQNPLGSPTPSRRSTRGALVVPHVVHSSFH
eukprot:203046-Chlamydomonas_euryale.AAC.3